MRTRAIQLTWSITTPIEVVIRCETDHGSIPDLRNGSCADRASPTQVRAIDLLPEDCLAHLVGERQRPLKPRTYRPMGLLSCPPDMSEAPIKLGQVSCVQSATCWEIRHMVAYRLNARITGIDSAQ